MAELELSGSGELKVGPVRIRLDAMPRPEMEVEADRAKFLAYRDWLLGELKRANDALTQDMP